MLLELPVTRSVTSFLDFARSTLWTNRNRRSEFRGHAWRPSLSLWNRWGRRLTSTPASGPIQSLRAFHRTFAPRLGKEFPWRSTSATDIGSTRRRGREFRVSHDHSATFWSAVAERSGDTAFEQSTGVRFQSHFRSFAPRWPHGLNAPCAGRSGVAAALCHRAPKRWRVHRAGVLFRRFGFGRWDFFGNCSLNIDHSIIPKAKFSFVIE
jgi:hypothetical protein